MSSSSSSLPLQLHIGELDHVSGSAGWMERFGGLDRVSFDDVFANWPYMEPFAPTATANKLRTWKYSERITLVVKQTTAWELFLWKEYFPSFPFIWSEPPLWSLMEADCRLYIADSATRQPAPGAPSRKSNVLLVLHKLDGCVLNLVLELVSDAEKAGKENKPPPRTLPLSVVVGISRTQLRAAQKLRSADLFLLDLHCANVLYVIYQGEIFFFVTDFESAAKLCV